MPNKRRKYLSTNISLSSLTQTILLLHESALILLASIVHLQKVKPVVLESIPFTHVDSLISRCSSFKNQSSITMVETTKTPLRIIRILLFPKVCNKSIMDGDIRVQALSLVSVSLYLGSSKDKSYVSF